MPSRIVRDGILTSLAVDRLSMGAENFYRRVINVVDDFGRYHATPALLRAAAYPLKIDKVLDKHILGWIKECSDAKLIQHYMVDGLPYIEVQKFGTPRAKDSKFPPPCTDANRCKQAQTDESNGTVVVVESVVVSETTLSDKSDDDREPSKAEVRFGRFWDFFPRKIGKGKAWAVFKRLNAQDQDDAIEQAEAYAQAFEMAPDARKQFFKHPATWLNARSWEDDHAEWELLIEGK